MRVEKIVVEPVVNILGLTEKEFMMLKVLINSTGHEKDAKVIDNESIWGDHMTLEEAQNIAGKVGNIIWGLTVEGDYIHCLESTTKRDEDEM